MLAAALAESGSTRAHVVMDHVERIVAHSAVGSRAIEVAGIAGTGGAGAGRPGLGDGATRSILKRLETPPIVGPVVHAECGDGGLVEQMLALGLDARGADPDLGERRAGRSTRLSAAGALEYLGAFPTGSLGGLVLTGAVERQRPGGARALARLAASRLAPGAAVVLVSCWPESTTLADPVAADLSGRRPLHPVTWCHLLGGRRPRRARGRRARARPGRAVPPATSSSPAEPLP